MAINYGRVVTGGLAAGVAFNVVNYLGAQVILGERTALEMEAFRPGLSAAMSTTEVITSVALNLLVGLLLVLAYASVRPRFGPGPRGAAYVALAFFVFGSTTTTGYMALDIMSPGLWLAYAIVYIVSLMVGTMIGASMYREDGSHYSGV